jgi:hypothetical protein
MVLESNYDIEMAQEVPKGLPMLKLNNRVVSEDLNSI